jgi:hypothetical protein
MAADSANDLSWYLTLSRTHTDYLGQLRHWPNLQVGFEESRVWLTGFTPEQLDSVAVQTIPHKQLFYAHAGRLFPKGSRLPARVLPSVLWSGIGRALPVSLPSHNYNFFGLTDTLLSPALQPADTERPAAALLTYLPDLAAYIETAPAVRLEPLRWLLLGPDRALLLGLPLLPIRGDTYWQKSNWLLPTGLDTAHPLLDAPLDTRLNPTATDYLLWQPNATYLRLPKEAFKPLTISSFKLSLRDCLS